MRKITPYIAIIFALGAILFFLKNKDQWTDSSEHDFRIENVKDIGSVELSNKNGEKTTLIHTKEGWQLASGYPVRKDLIRSMIETLNKLNVEMPVPDTFRKLAIENIRRKGIEIKIKNQDGDEIKTIYIGDKWQSGNYMILSHDGVVSPTPYLVNMPGSNADLIYRFSTDEEDWKSSAVFETPVDKIKSIQVVYHENPTFSFILTKDDDVVKINPLIDSARIDKKLDQYKVVQYLLEFENKNYELRLTQDSMIQKIKSSKPYVTIELTDVFDEKRNLILYRRPPSNNALKDARGLPLPFDIEKYWGYYPQRKEYALVQHYNFGPILERYSYFFVE